MTDHTDVVAQAKADVVALGVNITTPCGAHAIVRLAAWRLRSEGAGLLAKPTGENCEGYSVDIIAFNGGDSFDVLVNSQTENRPAWNSIGQTDPTRWRPPIDPGFGAPTPAPGPTPIPTPAPEPIPGEPTIPVDSPPAWFLAFMTDVHGLRADVQANTSAAAALSTKLDGLVKGGVKLHF